MAPGSTYRGPVPYEPNSTSESWTPYGYGTLPAKGQKVEWLTPSGEVVRGTYVGGVIWMPEGSGVYIYYTPTYWRAL
jgi:hypothetical protein